MRLAAVLAGVVLALALAVTHQLWAASRTDQREDAQAEFEYRVRDAEARISQRMLAYEGVLRGVAGLFAASARVERGVFRDYVAALRLEENYPGVLGSGFALVVPGSSIRAGGTRAQSTSIVFLEPATDANRRVLGYDMYSEPVRRAALERARDSGAAAITGMVTLLQDQANGAIAGFLMYLPVYGNGAPHGTVAERRANILGWVYLPFRTRDLMLGVFGERASELDIDLYDGAVISQSALMYDGGGAHLGQMGPEGPDRAVRHLAIAGREWTLVIRSLSSFEKLSDHRPRIVAVAGGLASALLTLLVLLLTSGRARALRAARRMNRDLIRTQDALQESEVRFRAMADSAKRAHRFAQGTLDAMAEHVCVLDGDGVVISVNRAWRAFATANGAPARCDYVGSNYLAACAHAAGPAAELAERFRVALTEILSGQRETFSFEYPCHAPGEERWFIGAATRFDEGEGVQVVVSHTDITARAVAERAQRESEARVVMALAASETDIWEWNGVQGLLRIGPRWSGLLGLTGDGLAVQDVSGFSGLFHPDDRARVEATVRAYLDHGQAACVVEARVRSAAGEERWALMRGSAVERNAAGGPTRMIGTLRDISERKLLEAQRERLLEQAWTATHQRERMLAVVAHDLRSPVAAVGLAAHALERFCSDPALRESFGERLEIIRLSTERMGRLIEDLLDVASIQSGRLRLSPALSDPAAIARDAVRVVADDAQRRGIRLELENRGVLPAAHCDRGRVAQVLGNLLSNAFQATGAGGSVTVSVSACEEDVVFSVLDDGRGLPPGGAERLFEPYERGPDPGYKGAGLGLAIAKGIVDEHGGRIWAESTEAGGAAFRFAIPNEGSPRTLGLRAT